MRGGCNYLQLAGRAADFVWWHGQGDEEEEETDNLVNQVLDEIGINLDEQMVAAPGQKAQVWWSRSPCTWIDLDVPYSQRLPDHQLRHATHARCTLGQHRAVYYCLACLHHGRRSVGAFTERVHDTGGCSRWPTRKQQSSMLSPWEREWAQGAALGTARAQGAALGTHLRARQVGRAAEAEAPLSRAMASTRISKPAWTTSESLEQSSRGVGQQIFYRHAAPRAGLADEVSCLPCNNCTSKRIPMHVWTA